MIQGRQSYLKKGIITLVVMMMVLLLQGTAVFAAGSAKLSNDGTEVMPVEHYPVTLDKTVGTTTRDHLGSYDEALRNVYTFLDAQKQLNVASFSGSELTVQVYDSSFQVKKTFSITPRYARFGGIICDANGNYYVVWAQYDDNQTNCVTMCIAKYNSSGTFLKELLLNGQDTSASGLSNSGTRYPFQFGNTSLAIQKGTLAVHYARVMYNGHQSNMIIYVDCDTMARKTGTTCYISHSFDQRAYATADGNSFLFLNQGDAYYRGFKISQVNASTLNSAGEFYNFHFREGTVRYQEVFAQMGGIAEVNGGYVFLGASERALDHVDNSSAGKSGKAIDARDLFLQVLKKDFKNYSGANKFALAGETRAAKPSTLSTAPHYFVSSDVDYGVNWLTNYDVDHYASNPKVVAIGNEQFAIMWEKRSYSGGDVDTYYAVMDANGNVVKDTMILQDCLLAADMDPVFLNGKIYWTTKDKYGFRINVLNVNSQSIPYHDHEFEEASRSGNNVMLRCKICGTTREIITTSSISFYLSVNGGGYRWSSTYESSGLSANAGDQIATWINVDSNSTDDLEVSIADGRLATFADGTTKTTAKDPVIVAKAGGKVAVTIRPLYVSNPVAKTFYLNVKKRNFAITFDANGGTDSMAATEVMEGATYELPKCTFTAPAGMEFAGWEVGGDLYEEGKTLIVSDNITVKATWKEQVNLFQLAGASMNLGNSLDMLFLINQTDVTETDYYATIRKVNADKDDTVKTYQFSEWYTYGSYYLLQYDELTAKEMNDMFYVQVFHADGTPASECYEDSVADYALRGFDGLSEAEKRLSVDLLFYGAAAQKTFNYDTAHLVSDRMTDAQKEFAMKNVSGENHREVKDYPYYYGTTLDLQSTIKFYLFFNGVPRDGYAKISFTNHNGTKESYTIQGSEYLIASETLSVIVVEKLTIPDARRLVTCEVYAKDGNLLDSVTDSIESYVFRGTTGEIDEAVMKFADSAYNYFHPTN